MGIGFRHAGLVSFIILCSFLAHGQQFAPRPLITRPIDETQLRTVRGSTHPLARPQFDLGIAPPDLPMNRMLLVLKRSPQQDFALHRLLDDQQDKGSANYRRWLTPDDFGQQFGPSDQDIQQVTGWLQGHGFQVNSISRGRTVIEFSGVESQVEAALHTQIHQYMVNGEMHWANASDPQIPAALAPAVAGVRALNDFRPKRFSRLAGEVVRSKSDGQITSVKASFTLGGKCGVQTRCYGIGPYDFATIYDLLPSWNAPSPIDGAGQTIAIVGETDIFTQDVTAFRAYFGLPAYGQPNGPTFTITHNGPAPGVFQGEETEADLDVEWSGAVAKNANINFVVSQPTETTSGVDLSALYIVDNNLAPVMSESYGLCELYLGPAGNQFFNSLWAQAAAQGISVMLSSGDGGSAGCDDFNQAAPATVGLQVSGFASTPYNTAVGGTDFSDLKNASTYWSSINKATTRASALSYIPETTWDDNCTNPVFASLGFSANAESNCNNTTLITDGFLNILGGSGGRSNCINSDGSNPSSCAGGYAKPSWQSAPGVPADGVRDLPDVSLYAAVSSPSGSFYVVCEADAVSGASCDPNIPSSSFLGIGGTSASAPAFAGIMALVNQQEGARQGNANFVLYKLAQQHPSVFHDVTTGTIAVPCLTGTTDCNTTKAGDQYGILSGYSATKNYDLATGIGSVDAGALLQNWSSATFRSSLTTLALNPTTNLTHGQAVSVSGSVAPGSGSGTPTGSVSLITSAGVSAGGFTLSGGTLSGSTNLLPGGTYTVSAHYAGDLTFGGSDSAPVSVTVGKENSSAQLRLVTFDWQGNLISNNASSAVYGSPYILRANVLNSQGAVCAPSVLGPSACPTGNVTLKDNGNLLDGGTFPLNSLGYTEDQTIQLSGGSNAIQAQYVGDNSFNASSATTTYNIARAATTITVPFTAFTAAVGDLVALSNTILAQPTSGVPPTGTVTFFANGTPIIGMEQLFANQYGAQWNNFTSASSVSLASTQSPFTAPGTYAITASYSGDGNYLGSTSPALVLSVKFPAPGIAMQASAASVTAGTAVTVTTLVKGFSKTLAPTGTITFSGYEGPLTGNVSYTTTTDANTGNLDLQGTISIAAAFSDSFAAQYNGDTNYPGATTNGLVLPLTVTGGDFSLGTYPQQNSLTVIRNFTGNLQLFAGLQSNSGAVSLTCSGLPSESSCTFIPGAETGTGAFTLQVSTTAPHTVASNFSSGLIYAGLMPLSALFLLPVSRRRLRRGLLMTILCLLFVGVGCGGGSGGGVGGGGGGGGKTDPGTPVGTYTITVTGTNGSFTHSTTFSLVVQ